MTQTKRTLFETQNMVIIFQIQRVSTIFCIVHMYLDCARAYAQPQQSGVQKFLDKSPKTDYTLLKSVFGLFCKHKNSEGAGYEKERNK